VEKISFCATCEQGILHSIPLECTQDFYMVSPQVTAMTWLRTVILNGISSVPTFEHITGVLISP